MNQSRAIFLIFFVQTAKSLWQVDIEKNLCVVTILNPIIEEKLHMHRMVSDKRRV